MIVNTIEIGRPADEVFSYLDEVDKHSEWQDALVSSRVLTDGPVGVGTRVADTRKVPGGPREMTYEITEHQPPRRSAWRGIDGPVRPVGSVTVEPAGEGRSRVTLELDLQGHGIGVLFAPLARMQAGKQVPKDQAKLKEVLERSAPSASPGQPGPAPTESAPGPTESAPGPAESAPGPAEPAPGPTAPAAGPGEPAGGSAEPPASPADPPGGGPSAQ